MKTIKLTTFNDLGVCDRQDVNDLIASLVRIGYEVWITDDSVCFNLGNDDVIKDEKNEGSLVIHEAESELIKWIQDTQSEVDLQTKTSKEILEEYENKKYE
jgi:hypothetical protein